MEEPREPENLDQLIAELQINSEAFGKLYDFYQPRIFRYVVSRVGSYEDAEDITSATFEKALKNIERYDSKKGKFFTWLYQIAHNLVVDHYKKKRPVRLELEDAEKLFPEFTNTSSGELEEVEAYMSFLVPLQKLDDKYKDVLLLRFFELLTPGDIAEVLGISKKCVSTRTTRGLKALGKLLEKTDSYSMSRGGNFERER